MFWFGSCKTEGCFLRQTRGEDGLDVEDVGQVLLGILPQQVQGVRDVGGEGGGRGGVQQGVQHPQPLL